MSVEMAALMHLLGIRAVPFFSVCLLGKEASSVDISHRFWDLMVTGH